MGTGIFSVRTTRVSLREKLRQVLSQSENTCTHKRALIDLKDLPEHFPHLTSTYAILRSELTRQSLC